MIGKASKATFTREEKASLGVNLTPPSGVTSNVPKSLVLTVASFTRPCSMVSKKVLIKFEASAGSISQREARSEANRYSGIVVFIFR